MYVFQVAGVIAASGNNGHGISGVAWSGIKLIGCRVYFGQSEEKAASGVVTCLDFCQRQKANITQNSFGTDPNRPFNQMMYDKYISFGTAGGLSFMAAGNDGQTMLGFDFQGFNANNYANNRNFPGPQPAGYAATPLGLKSMINVASMTKLEIKPNVYQIGPASYTGFGAPYVDLFAPGGESLLYGQATMLTVLGTKGSAWDKKNDDNNITTDKVKTNNITWDNAYYMSVTGTSFASPHVAGAAALVWAEYPQLTNAQVKSILCSTASNSGIFTGPIGSGTNPNVPYSSYGVLNDAAAIAKATKLKSGGAITA